MNYSKKLLDYLFNNPHTKGEYERIVTERDNEMLRIEIEKALKKFRETLEVSRRRAEKKREEIVNYYYELFINEKD